MLSIKVHRSSSHTRLPTLQCTEITWRVLNILCKRWFKILGTEPILIAGWNGGGRERTGRYACIHVTVSEKIKEDRAADGQSQ